MTGKILADGVKAREIWAWATTPANAGRSAVEICGFNICILNHLHKAMAHRIISRIGAE